MLRRAVPLLAALALAAGAGAAVAAPAPAPAPRAAAPAVSTVKLAVRIETTSDWAKVQLAPGRIEATRVLRTSPGAEVLQGSRGWELRPLVGSGFLELEAVFDDAGRAASYAVELQKGAVGSSRVTVRNTTGTPFTVLDATNRVASPSDPTNTKTVRLPRRAVLGDRQLALPRADARRLVLAFYYPWFGGGYADPELTDRPAAPRTTTDPAGVLSMTRQARSVGVDGFVLSFSGEQRDGGELDLALSAAEKTRGVVTPYLETTEAVAEAARTAQPRHLVVQQWLSEALKRSGNPAFLQAGGESVVFVWDADALTPQEWELVLRTSRAAGTPVRLVTDALQPEYEGVSWGGHRYVVNESLPELAASHRHLSLRAHAPAALDRAVAPRLYAATVSPGYDDTALRGDTNAVVPRGAKGERYAGSWSAATQSRPDWVLLNSWNEWYEGTSVEPGQRAGDLALRQTKGRAAAWHRAR